MRHILALVFAMLVASCTASVPAFARPHHSYHRAHFAHHFTGRHHRYARRARATAVAHSWFERTETPSEGSAQRPRDCYGIAWCGCWLRHQFGLASTSLNLAINWARMGVSASPGNANVAVWRHHVGKVLAYRDGQILLQSGNDGHAVRTRWRPIRGVVALRRV